MSTQESTQPQAPAPLMVRTTITRPDRSIPSSRIIDWNDHRAVKKFSYAAREALRVGGSALSEALK